MIVSLVFFSLLLSVGLTDDSTVCSIASADGGQPYCENGLRVPCSVTKKTNTDALVDAGLTFAVGAFSTWLPPAAGFIKSFLNPMTGSSLKAVRSFTSEAPSACDLAIINWVAANYVTIDDFDQFKQDVNANFLISSIADDFLHMDDERYTVELHADDLLDDMTDASALGTYVQHLLKVAHEARWAISNSVSSLVDDDFNPSAVQAALVYIVEGAKVGFQSLIAAYAIIPYCWYHDTNEDCDPSYFMNELEDFKSKIEDAKAAITSTVYEKLRVERENFDRVTFNSYSQDRVSSCQSCSAQENEEWCGDNDAGCGQMDSYDPDNDKWPGDDRRRKLQSTYWTASCVFETEFEASECYYTDNAFTTGSYAYQDPTVVSEPEAFGDTVHNDNCGVADFAKSPSNPQCSDSRINTDSCSHELTTRDASTSCTSDVKSNLMDRLANEYEAELASFTSQLFTVEERFSAPVEITLVGETGLEQVTITDNEGTEHFTHERVSEDGSVFRFNVPTDGIFYLQWDLTTNPSSQGYLVGATNTYVQGQFVFSNEDIVTFELASDTEYLESPSGEMSEIIGTMMHDMYFDLSSLPLEKTANIPFSGLLATPESWTAHDDGTYIATVASGEVAIPVRQACGAPDSPDRQTGKSCPANDCLNDDKSYNTLYEAWKACSVIYGCDHVMFLDTDGYYYLRRETDPDSSSGQLYTYECTSSSYNDAHYHVEIEGSEPAVFKLRGDQGTEQITITSGSYVLSTTLTTEEQTFTVPLTKSGTFTIDHKGTTGIVYLTSDIDFDVSLPWKWGTWGCGLTNVAENYRCETVRTKKRLVWDGPYVVSMPKIDFTPTQETAMMYIGNSYCRESDPDGETMDKYWSGTVASLDDCKHQCETLGDACLSFDFSTSSLCQVYSLLSTAVKSTQPGRSVCYTKKTVDYNLLYIGNSYCRESDPDGESIDKYWSGTVVNFDECEAQCESLGDACMSFDFSVKSLCQIYSVLSSTVKSTQPGRSVCYTKRIQGYLRVEETCPETCNTILSVDACSAAGEAMGLGSVQVQHQSGHLPGCFFDETTGQLEFNSDLASTDDLDNTDSICDCRSLSTSSPFTAKMYNEQLEDGSKGVVTGDGAVKSMFQIQANTPYATLTGMFIKRSIL